MSKVVFPKTGLLLLIIITFVIKVAPQNVEFNKPVSLAARQSFKRAEKLAEQEKFIEGLAELKKTIAAAPQFVEAHAKYISLTAYFLQKPNDIRAEYANLMAKNPANPVYPAALAVALIAEPQQTKREWYEAVTDIAPDWVWAHYARAQLLQDQEPDKAVAELLKMIEKEPTAIQPYTDAIYILRFRLKNTDDAIALAEKMINQPELRAAGLSNLWRARLAKAGNTDEAKAQELREELSQIAASSRDVSILAAVHSAYVELLADNKAAQAIKEKINRFDPGWYPERGLLRVTTELKDYGPENVIYAGRRLAIYNKLRTIDYDLPAEEQLARLKELLTLNPDVPMKRKLYTRFFGVAERAGDNASIIRFGKVLLTFNAEDASVLSVVAQSLAIQKKELGKALGYVSRASELTKEFRIVKDVAGIAGNKFYEEYYSEKEQTQRYKDKRSQILEAYGWVLFQLGRHAEAEVKLRESIEIWRSERKLSLLSKILQALNRSEEAEKYAAEAKNEYTATLKRQFTNTPALDFELSTIDGRLVKLSALKGKVVMVNFWATWCQPCIKEIPLFIKTYEKYKGRGFEILAISVDDAENRPKVSLFANRLKINFPILYDEGIAKLYGAKSFPTTLFIGREGNIRYRNFGLIMETAERDLEVIIEELMKDN